MEEKWCRIDNQLIHHHALKNVEKGKTNIFKKRPKVLYISVPVSLKQLTVSSIFKQTITSPLKACIYSVHVLK